MKIGYFAVGIGIGAEPENMTVTAQTADQAGFHSLWAPEHVVLINQYASRYPYSQDGRLPMSTQIDILDPFTALTFAAATTKNIRLGTGICLVPERNPVVTAKEVASLDKLSGGRFDFGVGVGWLAEEFDAVGGAVAAPRPAHPRVSTRHEAAVDRGRARVQRRILQLSQVGHAAQAGPKAPPADYLWRREYAGPQAGR